MCISPFFLRFLALRNFGLLCLQSDSTSSFPSQETSLIPYGLSSAPFAAGVPTSPHKRRLAYKENYLLLFLIPGED